MKHIYNRFKALLIGLGATVAAFAIGSVNTVAPRREFMPRNLARQGGFIRLLSNNSGYLAGTVVEMTASQEDALIKSGQALTDPGPPTAGPVTTTQMQGTAAIAAGSSSVKINHASVNKQTKIFAIVSQAAADGTLLRVERVFVEDGAFTIYGTANATALVQIDWAVLNTTGSLTNPQ